MASSAARPRIVVITGPSGAGKGTLIPALVRRLPVLEVAVSATTRERRRGERDGRDYWFLSEDEFERRVRDGEFLEHVRYVSGRYGTLLSELDRIAAAARVCVLELEIEGALAVREAVPGNLTIFVTAPVDELERRLRERATETSGEIDERVALARRQLEHADEFDYVVVNDDLGRALDELVAIVERELAPAGTMAP